MVAFMDWLADWRQAEPDARAGLTGRGRELAAIRRGAFKALIERDPRAALANAVPRSLRSQLPAEVLAELEVPVDTFASYEVAVALDGNQRRVQRWVVVGDDRYKASVYGARLRAACQSRFSVHGIVLDGVVAVAEEPYRMLEASERVAQGVPSEGITVAVGDGLRTFESQAELTEWAAQVAAAEAKPGMEASRLMEMASGEVARLGGGGTATLGDGVTSGRGASSSWTIGEKTVLWVRVDFSDDPGLPGTDEEILSSMAEVSEFYRDVSRDRCSFKTTILPGALRLSAPKADYVAKTSTEYGLRTEAISLAKAYDTAHGGAGTYNPDLYDRVLILFRSVSSFNWSGLGYVGASGVWLNGTTSSFVVAHELGHNHGLWHSSSVPGPGIAGELVEYGDNFDVMGQGPIPASHFNAAQKSRIEYLSATEIVPITTSGIQRIYRSDSRTASGVQSVSIPRGTDGSYWLEYRQQAPSVYFTELSRLRNGIVLHYAKSDSNTMLLDATPGSSHGTEDAPLAMGETFTDVDYGIHVTPVGVGGTDPNQWIEVQVQMGAVGDNHNPFVALAPSVEKLVARTDVTFSASGTDVDGDTVYYRWDFGDGQVYPTTANVTTRWLLGGTYDVSVTALDGKGGLATQTVSVEVDDPLLHWTPRGSALTQSDLMDVTYGGGLFVAVGSGAAIAISPDGVEWAMATVPLTQSYYHTFRSVAYGEGRYVAVGTVYDAQAAGRQRGMAVSSTDGSVWRRMILPQGMSALSAVSFGAGRFVAVGAGGKIYYSTDGLSWGEGASGVSDDLNRVHFSGGVFVAVGNNGCILTSSDGATWVNRTPASCVEYLTGLTWSNGMWYATGYQSTWASGDAIQWTRVGPVTLGYAANLLKGVAGYLLMPLSNGTLAVSETGSAWAVTPPVDSTSSGFFSAAEGNGTVVLVGRAGRIMQSGGPRLQAPVLVDRAGIKELPSGQVATLAASGDGYTKLELLVDGVVVDEIAGGRGDLHWSPSGFGVHQLVVRGTTAGGEMMQSLPTCIVSALSWTRRAQGMTSAYLLDVIYAGGLFTAVGGSTVMHSPNGVDWLSTSVQMPGWFNGVAYGDGRYVAVGAVSDGTTAASISQVFSSEDGMVWHAQSLPSDGEGLHKVCHGAGRFVAVGAAGKIYVSMDGVSWREAVSGTLSNLWVVHYADGQFVAAGANGRVLISRDGFAWEDRSPSSVGFVEFNSVTWHDGLWYLSSYSEIWTSPDGATWSAHPVGSGMSVYAILVSRGVLLAPGFNAHIAISPDLALWGTMFPRGSVSENTGLVGLYGAAEGNGTVVVVGSDGGILQAGTPAMTPPALVDEATLAELPAGEPAVLRATGSAYTKLELLVDGTPLDEISGGDGVFRWTPPGFGVHHLAVRGTTSAGVVVQSLPVKVNTSLRWVRRAEGATSASLQDVLYAGGRFVAVGRVGAVLCSPTGETWTSTSLSGGDFLGVCYGDGRYVAVGGVWDVSLGRAVGLAVSFVDGSVLQKQVVPPGAAPLNAVAYGAGRFVAVGTGGAIYVSTDGVTWGEAVSGTTDDLLAIRYADGQFVAVGNNGRLLTSADGLSWGNRSPALAVSDRLDSVIWHGGLWYVTSYFSIWTSPDFVTWTAHRYGGPGGFYDLDFALGTMLVPSSEGRLGFAESFDAWGSTMPGGGGSESLYFWAVTEGDGTAVVVGSDGAIYQTVVPGLTISKIEEQQVAVGGSTGALRFTVHAAQTAAENLVVTADSSNPLLVPRANVILGGGGEERTVTVTPAPGLSGRALITVTVSDGTLSVRTSFQVRVQADIPAIVMQPTSSTVHANTPATFSVQVNSALPLTYRWQLSIDGGTTWSSIEDGAAYAGATTESLTVKKAGPQMAGTLYRCQISDGVSPLVVSASATLSVKWSQFSALSTRAPVATGDQTLILGFVFAGGGKPTVVRGVGPSLQAYVSGYLEDPQLRLNALVGGAWADVVSNDDWDGLPASSARFNALGMGALLQGSKDAAVFELLSASIYTAQIAGADGGAGVAQAEAYDANFADKTRRLTALSVRNQVGTGERVLIAGFVLVGDAPKKVIVRGVGPGLAEAVDGYLADPQIHVHRLVSAEAGWSLVAENDDWDHTAETAALFQSAGMGALGSDSKDAALVLNLQPGIYTAQISGVGGTTGIGLVEIYEAP